MTVRLTLEEAIKIATRAHDGTFDRSGVTPYIEHPLAVMRRVHGEDTSIVAVLHDVLEDTLVSVDDLRASGASDEQIDALLAVTHRPDEPYAESVERALAHPIGRVVKIADHEENTDPARLSMLEPETAARLRRKYAAVAHLINRAREEAATAE